MSEFTFKCPHCGTNIICDDSMNGQNALCPNCDNNIILKKDHPFINEQLLEEQKERERQERERQLWEQREREWLEWKREQEQREQELKQNLKTLEVEKELLVQLDSNKKCLEPNECRWSLAARLFAIVDLIVGFICIVAGADADDMFDKTILINCGIWTMISSIPAFLASWFIQQTYVSNNLKKQQILLLNKIARKMKIE